ncbi:thioesterase II family protein [Streptomyces sp. NPDC014734]|uniref:thioesterase II family protein n=1 Tax=Streptomyces sp. NPDC014734 TaxID=3364886 RepID=UPI0036FA028C
MVPSSALRTPWLRTFQPVASPRARIVCFPHAGGTASFFRTWHPAMPEGWEVSAVRYPGREERIIDPLIGDMTELAEQIADALAPHLGTPTAFFGHSMGASVAHEVAALLAARDATKTPVALFVSGRGAPHRLKRVANGDLTDEQLLATVHGLGGPGAELLRDPELQELVLPPIRSDYELLDAYAAGPKAPAVSIPITAYYGESDPGPSAEDVRAWSELTTAPFEARSFTGGHFFLVDHEVEVIGDFRRRLGALL